MPTSPELSILIFSVELVAKTIGLAPVVEAVRVPLFQKSGDLTEVKKSLLSPQRSFVTVRYVDEAFVIVPLVANNLVVVALVIVSSATFPVVPQKFVKVALVVEELANVDRLEKFELPLTVKSLEIDTVPFTPSVAAGEVEAIPTLPPYGFNKRLFAESAATMKSPEKEVMGLLNVEVAVPVIANLFIQAVSEIVR